MKVQFQGSGDSAGIPVYGCSCAVCAAAHADPSVRRGPSSVLLEADDTRVLIDAGAMDLCERFAPGSLTSILLTHYHVDHVQGLFHMRWGTNLRVPVIGPEDEHGCADLYKYPGILDFSIRAKPFEPLQLGSLQVTPLPLQHSVPTLGYVVEHNDKRLAYLTDTRGLPQASAQWLSQAAIDLMVIDCMYPPGSKPSNHNDVDSALACHATVRPGHTLLTHISHDTDVWLQAHADRLPGNVTPARDGLEYLLS